jgi:hypothetical protein
MSHKSDKNWWHNLSFPCPDAALHWIESWEAVEENHEMLEAAMQLRAHRGKGISILYMNNQRDTTKDPVHKSVDRQTQ